MSEWKKFLNSIFPDRDEQEKFCFLIHFAFCSGNVSFHQEATFNEPAPNARKFAAKFGK